MKLTIDRIAMAVLIIALLVTNRCKQEDFDEMSVLAEEAVEMSKQYADKAASLEKEIPKYHDSIDALKAANIRLEEEKKQLRVDRDRKQAEIANYSAVQVADYLNYRYHTDGANATGVNISVTDTLGRKVVTDLDAFDYMQEELAITEIQLSNEKKSGKAKDSIISIQEEQKGLLQKSAEAVKQAYDLQNIQLSSEKKENRKLRRREWIWKVSVPAAFGAGAYIGSKI